MSVLSDVLPPKKEFVITVPLTDLQIKAYSLYVRSMISDAVHARTKSGQVQQTTIWHWLAILSLLCNHPSCFNAKLNQRKEDAEKEVAVSGTLTPLSLEATDAEEAIAADINAPIWKTGVSEELVRSINKLFKEETLNLDAVDLSHKVKILCQILDASRLAGDKTLVFSQSIQTLDFLEKLCFEQGRNFARLDGKTPIRKRQAHTKAFNNGSLELYLISTGAGGLGLNLPGANRVVIFDFKFNPIMEEQAIGRAYRIGQKKNTFVYRFISGGTFEDSVYNKVVFKSQLSARVVDKKNPVAWATKSLGEFLFEPKDVAQKDLSEFEGKQIGSFINSKSRIEFVLFKILDAGHMLTLSGMDPLVLDGILESQSIFPTIRSIVQSDTFERDDNDKLTADEEKEVRQMLDEEKLKRSDPGKWQELQQMRNKPAPAQQAMTAQATRPLAQDALQVKSAQPSNSSGTVGHVTEKPAILPPQYGVPRHGLSTKLPTTLSTSNALHPQALGAGKEEIVKAASQPAIRAANRSISPDESKEKRQKVCSHDIMTKSSVEAHCRAKV
jgi:SNF2 family DNA or RNA helicase